MYSFGSYFYVLDDKTVSENCNNLCKHSRAEVFAGRQAKVLATYLFSGILRYIMHVKRGICGKN